MPQYTDEDVCNAALAHLGEYQIEDIYDATGNIERLCRLHLPTSRRTLLKSHAWNFAETLVELTLDVANPPAFKYASAFLLPDDYLMALDIWVDEDATMKLGRHTMARGKLLCDEETAFLCYVADITCPTEWDTDFFDILALDLASKLAVPLGAGDEKKNAIITELETINKPQAWLNNSREDDSNENNVIDELVNRSNLVNANQTVI